MKNWRNAKFLSVEYEKSRGDKTNGVNETCCRPITSKGEKMEGFLGWFKGLKGRLLVLAVFPVVMMAVISVIALHGIENLSDNLQNAGEVRGPKIRSMGEMDSARNAIFRWLWATYVNEGDIEGRNKTLAQVRSNIKRHEEARKIYESLPRDEKEKQLYSTFESNWPKAMQAINESIALLEKHNANDNKEARKIMSSELRSALEPIAVVFADLREYGAQQIKTNLEENAALSSRVKSLTVAVSGIGAAVLFLICIFMASQLAKSLTNVTSKISESGVQVSTASTQLSSASQQLSSGATEAAASLQETVASIEELSSMVKLNADHAKEAAGLSQTSRQAAEEGESEIKQLIGAMTDISSSSKKIEEIINVIDDIAFQTNILALNAAVEAARAGEQGKGFAVVAEAVRNLAQRSGGAAKEIATLIKDSVSKVDHGSKIADRSGSALNTIVTSIKKVADLNNEISSASQEQATGLEQISKAMNQLDQATQGNAASAEEVAASSEEMSAQAVALKGMVTDLASIVYGKSGEEKSGNGDTSARPEYKRYQGPEAPVSNISQLKSYKDRKGELRSLNGHGHNGKNDANGVAEYHHENGKAVGGV